MDINHTEGEEFCTRGEVVREIEVLEQAMYRARQDPRQTADANQYENAMNELVEILEDTNWNTQLADCRHLFLLDF